MRARVLHRRTPFGEVLGWRWPTTCAATRITTAQSPTHCAARQCNLRPRHLFVRPFSSLPASRAQCLFTDSPSRAALHLRGAYAVRTDPIPSIQSIRVPDQDVDAWRNAETPLYGWPWPSDNQTSWSHDWPGTETMAHSDFRHPPSPCHLQRTNSNTRILRRHPSPLATMRCANSMLRRMHHDLPHNQNHT